MTTPDMNSLSKIFFILILGAVWSCSSGGSPKGESKEQESASSSTESQAAEESSPADPMESAGIGPVENVELGELDQALAEEGKLLFKDKCSACHKADKKYIGPAPKDILERRSPEWVMNMILNPTEMIQKDPTAKKLLAEANGAIMANQNLERKEARAILEYFRTIE